MLKGSRGPDYYVVKGSVFKDAINFICIGEYDSRASANAFCALQNSLGSVSLFWFTVETFIDSKKERHFRYFPTNLVSDDFLSERKRLKLDPNGLYFRESDIINAISLFLHERSMRVSEKIEMNRLSFSGVIQTHINEETFKAICRLSYTKKNKLRQKPLRSDNPLVSLITKTTLYGKEGIIFSSDFVKTKDIFNVICGKQFIWSEYWDKELVKFVSAYAKQVNEYMTEYKNNPSITCLGFIREIKKECW